MFASNHCFLRQQRFLCFHLVLIVLLHQVLIFAELANTSPFVCVWIPPPLLHVRYANSVLAKLAKYSLKYQSLDCSCGCRQILHVSLGYNFSSCISVSESFLRAGSSSRELCSFLLSRKVLKAANFFFFSRPV